MNDDHGAAADGAVEAPSKMEAAWARWKRLAVIAFSVILIVVFYFLLFPAFIFVSNRWPVPDWMDTPLHVIVIPLEKLYHESSNYAVYVEWLAENLEK